MQKYITSLLIATVLSGCASSAQVSKDNNDDFMKKKAAEEAGWAKLNELSIEKCAVSLAPPARERAVELSNCVTRLVKQYVLPDAVSPGLLLSSRAEALRIAQDYADGKISAEEYKRLSEDRLKNYSNATISESTQATAADL